MHAIYASCPAAHQAERTAHLATADMAFAKSPAPVQAAAHAALATFTERAVGAGINWQAILAMLPTIIGVIQQIIAAAAPVA